MPIPRRETFPTGRDDLLVQVTDDGSRTLVKTGTADAFHSGCGAVSETRHVYLQNSGVADRLRQGRPTTVLEIGLGTAMGMLMTVDFAVTHDCDLNFVSLETDWISSEILRELCPFDWLNHPGLAESYLQFRSSFPDQVPPGVYRWNVACSSKVQIHIHVADLLDWSAPEPLCVDAIYFDPFCPESCPELWTTACFSKLRRLIADDGTLTTYSCSRPVRSALQDACWSVDRVTGPPGGKREVLVARPCVRG